MQALFVTPYYYPEFKFGGPPQKIHSIARGLVALGHDVRVLTFDHSARRRSERIRIDGVLVQYLHWIGQGLRQVAFDRAILRGEIQNADVVHCYGLYTAIVPTANRMAKRAGKAVVHEPMGMFPPRGRNQLAKKIYNVAVTRRMLSRADAVIAASKAEVAALKGFVPSAKIVHRRNGIDVSKFASLPSPVKLRARWQLREQERAILFVGRLSPIKNLEQLVSAFARANLSNTRLIFVGPSEPAYEKSLRSLVSQKRLDERVVFAGPLYGDEQKAALSAADLFVLPSLNESFGNAAGEAVAAGVPVLLTETCGIAPMVHRRAGMAVPLGVESLAQGLRLMLESQVRDEMTARREEVRRELSWDEPIAQTIELYRELVHDKAG